MPRPTYISIDEQAFIHNIKRVRQIAPQSAIMAMIKANAYGHGVANLLSGYQYADALGVCCLEEALELRELGAMQPIVLMEGFFDANELSIIEQNDFAIVLHETYQVNILEKIQLTKPVNVWLKIDTGMHRLGFPHEHIKQIWLALSRNPNIKKPIHLMTHFADSDILSKPTTSLQIEHFNHATRNLEGPRSMACSAAILGWPQTHADWVRPGIMLYGVSPFADKVGADHNILPVMTLQSELVAIKHCRKGDKIGYGGTWCCPQDMLVGIVGIGYGDGYPRHAPNGTPVLVNEQQVSLIGRVSMDMISVDLRTQPYAKVGDQVILWGNKLPIEKIANASGTIGYELLCGVTKRVKTL